MKRKALRGILAAIKTTKILLQIQTCPESDQLPLLSLKNTKQQMENNPMTEHDLLQPFPEALPDPSEQLFLHLLRHPCDLVDARRLMRRFRVSPAEVQRVLGRIDKATPQLIEEAQC